MFESIEHFEEPKLQFGGNQTTEDPRDGLLLYGPYEKWGDRFKHNAYTITAGVIGNKEALAKYESFVGALKKPIISMSRNKKGKIVSNETQRPSFPGFEAVFDIHWPETPDVFIELKQVDIERILKISNRQVRTNELVNLYLGKMLEASSGEDTRVDIWFVIVSRRIFIKCRPMSSGEDFSEEAKEFLEAAESGETLFSQEEVFGGEISDYVDTRSDFHDLLKARANQEKLDSPIQIIVEPKLDFRDILHNLPYEDDMKATIAWSLCTTLYYKLGKKPWKLAKIRPGVCYIGLVFKTFPDQPVKQYACSAAQLFMSDGDGTVFRGNNGLWVGKNENEFHLDQPEAYNLLNLALSDYYRYNSRTYPKELFIHGRAEFSPEEWAGFQKAAREHDSDIKIAGIVIKDGALLKLFRDTHYGFANFGILRGIAAIVNSREAYLSTRGFVPRLNTSTSLEVPNPLHVRISRGDTHIRTVLNDIMKLTKLNYNCCIHGDGKPVTLRFSDVIGSILTATDKWKEERRQFRYYI